MGDIFWFWKRGGGHRHEVPRNNLPGTVIITIDRGVRIGV